MSKVADYLQGHIIGEISLADSAREAMSRDGSILSITPEIVAYPRVTNDIRKITRFAWQLAEKGHMMPVTVRGGGTDTTGAALTKGISLVTTAHMNRIFEIEPKQRLVRTQPGVTVKSLNDALQFHGLGIPSASRYADGSTIGGAIANNMSGPLSGLFGPTGKWIHQLEVVLASGDVLQTGRITKRELSKKKGLQGFEGDLYRGIDAIVEDNKELIASEMADGQLGNFGYALADIKHKDGSFDLTPLFVGSQGTLGIISEMIMKTDFINANYDLAAILCPSKESARDLLDDLRKIEPSTLDYFDGEVFDQAIAHGKKYRVFGESAPSAVILVGFYAFNERVRHKKLRKLSKLVEKSNSQGAQVVSSLDVESEDIKSLYDAGYYQVFGDKHVAALPLFDGIKIDADRLEDFSKRLAEIAEAQHVKLPISGRVLDDTYTIRPLLDLSKTGDKQKVFKLLDEVSKLVDACNGVFIAGGGEGRLKTRFAAKLVSDEINDVFAQVKKVCDPHGFLNPGVKGPLELKFLAEHMANTYPAPHLVDKLF